MVQFWYKLVKAGAKSIEDVPVKWRAQVEALLEGGE